MNKDSAKDTILGGATVEGEDDAAGGAGFAFVQAGHGQVGDLTYAKGVVDGGVIGGHGESERAASGGDNSGDLVLAGKLSAIGQGARGRALPG